MISSFLISLFAQCILYEQNASETDSVLPLKKNGIRSDAFLFLSCFLRSSLYSTWNLSFFCVLNYFRNGDITNRREFIVVNCNVYLTIIVIITYFLFRETAVEDEILKASQCKNPRVRVLPKSLLPRRLVSPDGQNLL